MKLNQLFCICSFFLVAFSASVPTEKSVLSLPGDEVFLARLSGPNSGFTLPTLEPGTYSVIIPLKRAGELFLFDATIDGESGNIFFDSGAKETVLNSTYFRKQGN